MGAPTGTALQFLAWNSRRAETRAEPSTGERRPAKVCRRNPEPGLQRSNRAGSGRDRITRGEVPPGADNVAGRCTWARVMAFRDFSFPEVQQALGLTVHDADLFSAAAPFPVREEIAAFVRD